MSDRHRCRHYANIAEAEGLEDVRFEKSSAGHSWMIGQFNGLEIRVIIAPTKTSCPRFQKRARGNIRQAIRRAQQGRPFAAEEWT